MGEQKEDLYLNFSRKDLQGLCKKYGLPANKSNSEMATSLILYLEKKNLNSRTIWGAARSDPFSSVTPALQSGARINLTADRRKDCRGKMSHSGSGNSPSHNRDIQQNHSQKYKGPATSDKASEDVGILTQVLNDSNSGAGLQENTFSSVVSPPVGAPPPIFQFDVTCEDGIQLFVDLNSTPSDWIESLKSGVHLCHGTDELESSSFHQELCQLGSSSQMKDSSLTNSYKEMDIGNVENGAYPTTMSTGAQAQPDEPDGRERTLSSPGLSPCSDSIYGLESIGEEKATLLSRLDSDAEKQVSNVNSGIIREEVLPAGTDVNVVNQITACNNNSGNSSSSGPKCSGMSENQDINSGNDVYKKPSFQQTYGPLNPVLKSRRSSASASVGMQSSPGTSLGDRVGAYLDLADQSQSSGREDYGLTHSVLLNSPSSNQTDKKQHILESEHGKASILSQSSRQSTGVPKNLARSRSKSTTLSPNQRCDSLGGVNLTKSIETKNGGILRRHVARQEASEMHSSVVGVQRKDTSLSPCRNSVSQQLVDPKQNGAGHCTPANSAGLNGGNSESQPITVEDLGRSNDGSGRESSECLDFRDPMEETWRRPSDSESNRELKGKRQINSIEDHSQSSKPNVKISRTSKQLSGDVRASRRRSSRLFPK